jgi:hypothetical protein
MGGTRKMPPKNPREPRRALEAITSDNPERRCEGWVELRQHSAAYRARLNDDQALYLLANFETEPDPKVRQAAVNALLAMALISTDETPPPKKPDVPPGTVEPGVTESGELLGGWLWEPFRKPSMVLGLTAANYRRRDEGALLWLGRRLSFVAYPDANFSLVNVENPELDRVLFDKNFDAFCLVGRLGLFGKKALKRLGDDDLRFGFDRHQRPENCPAAGLHPEFHRIFERTEGSRPKYYRTKQEDGTRTDYAVVQRYRVKLSGRYVVIVIIAGASSLGTFAASQWVARDLFRATDTMNNKAIEAPSDITPSSRLEVLLRVTAKMTTSAWEYPEIEIEKLRVEDPCWSLEDQQWREVPIKNLTVIYENDKPTQILFDGRPSRLDPGGQAFRLTVAIAEQVEANSRRQGELDIAALAANPAIWNNPNPDEPYVRQQLRLLKARYLKDALSMGKEVRLHATCTLKRGSGVA